MKNSLKIIYAISMSLMLLASSPASASIADLNLEVGDTFGFTIQGLRSTQVINGTDYSPSLSQDFEEGDKVEVEITDFTEDGSDTYVNFTQSIGGGTAEDVSALVDEWQAFYLIGIFAIFLAAAWESGNVDFEEPEEDEDEFLDVEGLPLFATGDEDFYNDFDADFDENADATLNVGGNITEVLLESDVDNAANTYHFRMNYRFVMSGVIDEEDADLDLSIDVITDVDYGRSIVTRLKLALGVEMTIGDASLDMDILMDIVEGDGDSGDDGPLPLNPIAVFFGFVALAVISRRFRN